MHISVAVLANGAAARDGLLFVDGGGWTFYQVPALPWTVTGWLAAIAELDDGDNGGTLQMRASGPNAPSGEPGHSQGTASMAIMRPPGEHGPLRIPLAVPFMFVAADVGPHRVTLSDESGPLTFLEFELRLIEPPQ